MGDAQSKKEQDKEGNTEEGNMEANTQEGNMEANTEEGNTEGNGEKKLETLRAQYEAEVAGLREQLDPEQGAEDDPSKDNSEAQAQAAAAAGNNEEPTAKQAEVTNEDVPDIEVTEPAEVTSEGLPDIEVTEPKLDEMAVIENLDKLQRQVMEHLREQLDDKQNEELDKLQENYNQELMLQLAALKTTLNGVHSSQLKVMREELENSHQLALEEQEKKLWKRHKVDLDRIQKDVVKSEAEWFIRMQEMAIRQKKSYEDDKAKALKELAQKQKSDMQKVLNQLGRATGYIQNMKDGKKDVYQEALVLAQKNAELQTEVDELRAQQSDSPAAAPLEADEREEMQIKIQRLEEQLQASGDIMARLRAEDGSEDFAKMPSDVQELQLRVSELEVEVSRLSMACAHEQERIVKMSTDHKQELEELQAQLNAARADVISELEYEIRQDVEAEKELEVQELKAQYEKQVQEQGVSLQSRRSSGEEDERCPSRVQNYEADFAYEDSEESSSADSQNSQEASPKHERPKLVHTLPGKEVADDDAELLTLFVTGTEMAGASVGGGVVYVTGTQDGEAAQGGATVDEIIEVAEEEDLEEGEDEDFSPPSTLSARSLSLSLQDLEELGTSPPMIEFESESDDSAPNSSRSVGENVGSTTSSLLQFELDENEARYKETWKKQPPGFMMSMDEDIDDMEALRHAMAIGIGAAADDALVVSGEEIDSDEDDSPLIGQAEVSELIKRRLMGPEDGDETDSSNEDSTATRSTVREDYGDSNSDSGGAVPYEEAENTASNVQEMQRRLEDLETRLLHIQDEHQAELAALQARIQQNLMDYTKRLYGPHVSELQRVLTQSFDAVPESERIQSDELPDQIMQLQKRHAAELKLFQSTLAQYTKRLYGPHALELQSALPQLHGVQPGGSRVDVQPAVELSPLQIFVEDWSQNEPADQGQVSDLQDQIAQLQQDHAAELARLQSVYSQVSKRLYGAHATELHRLLPQLHGPGPSEESLITKSEVSTTQAPPSSVLSGDLEYLQLECDRLRQECDTLQLTLGDKIDELKETKSLLYKLQTDLVFAHESELKLIKREHEKAITSLRRELVDSHESELETTKAELMHKYNTEMEMLQKRLLNTSDSDEGENREELLNEIEALKGDLGKKDREIMELKREVKKQARDYDYMQQELEEAHKSELDAKLSEEIHNFHSQFEEMKRELSEKHTEELEALREQHAEEMDHVREDTEVLYQTKIQELEQEQAAILNGMEKSHGELRAKHEEDLENLRSDVKNEVEAVQREELQTMRNNLIQTHSAELEGLRVQFTTDHKAELQFYRDELVSKTKMVEDLENDLEIQSKKLEELNYRSPEESSDDENIELYKVELQAKSETIQSLEAELDSLKEEANNLKSQLDEQNLKVEELQAKLSSGSDMVDNPEEVHSKHQAEMEILKQALDEKHQVELHSMKLDMEELIKTKEFELEHEVEKRVYEQLQAVQEDSIQPERAEMIAAMPEPGLTITSSRSSNRHVKDLHKKFAMEYKAQRVTFEAVIAALQSEMYRKLAQEKDDLGEEYDERLAQLTRKLNAAEAKYRTAMLERSSSHGDGDDSDQADLWQEKEAQLIADHYQMVLNLREDHEKEIEEMKEKHAEEMASLSQSSSADKDRLPSDWPEGDSGHAAAMEQLKADLLASFETEREAWETEKRAWDAEREELRGEKENEMIQRLQEEIKQLKDEHLADLENIKISIKEELLAENMGKLQAMTDQLEQSHLADLDEQKQQLQLQYQELIASLQEELRTKDEMVDTRIHEIEERHQQELSEACAKVNQQARKELEVEQTDALAAAALDTDTEKQQLVAAQTQELEELRRQHEENTAALEKQHKEVMERALHESEMESERVQSEMEGLMFDLQKQLDQQIQEAAAERAELESRIDQLQEQLSAAAEASENQVAKETAEEEEMEALKERMGDQVADLTEQCERLNKLLEQKKEELEQAQDLADDLETKLSEQKEHYELVLGRRTREHEEEDNLLTLVKNDLEKAQAEKESLNSNNERLRNILSETVMSSINLEEQINRQMAALVAEGRNRMQSLPGAAGAHGGMDPEDTSYMVDNSSLSDEGLDLSQRISESLFMGPDMNSDAELAADSGNRLQAAIDNLLDLVSTTTRQLQEAQDSQRELAATMEAKGDEVDGLSTKVEDLEHRLKEQTEAREYLTVELNKAEGLLEGYSAEKQQLEATITSLEEKKEMLIVELERAQSRLGELQEAETDVNARQEALDRQREALEQSLGSENQERHLVADVGASPVPGTPTITGLLAENNRLNEEKLIMEKQHERDREKLTSRLKELEMMIEESEVDFTQRMNDKKAEVEDLEKQIEVLDKKLKSNQQFLEEQANEREQEREDFQREIQRLHTIVKSKEKQGGQESRLQREFYVAQSDEMKEFIEINESQRAQIGLFRREVQDLEEQLRDRIDSNSELALKKEQVERDLEGQQVVLREQTDLIRHLEEEIDARAKNEKNLGQKMKRLESQLSQQEPGADLSDLSPDDSVTEGLQRHIRDLESQIEHLQKSDELHQQQKAQLEEQLKNLKTLEEELKQDKQALQKQVCDQMTQISSLKAQVDEMKLGVDHKEEEVMGEMRELRKLLQDERDAVEEKEKELLQLSDQLNLIRELVVEKDDQLQQMEIQLSSTDGDREKHLTVMENQLMQLQRENSTLKDQVATLRDQAPDSGMPVFAQTLIDEKNEELDQLNAELQELRRQLQSGEGDITAVLQHTIAAQPASDSFLELQGAEHQQIQDLRAELSQKTEELEAQAAEIEDLRQTLASLQETERRVSGADGTEEPSGVMRGAGDTVQDASMLHSKQEDIERVREEMRSRHEEDMAALQEVLDEKEALLAQMSGQLTSLQGEVHHLTDFQAQLQEDYDTVQVMLEKKQQEIQTLTKELEEARPQAEGISADVQAKYEDQVHQLELQLEGKQNIIDEKEEEMYTLNEQLQQQDDKLRDLSLLRTRLEEYEIILEEKADIIASLESRLAAGSDEEADTQSVADLQQRINDQQEEIQRLNNKLQHPLSSRIPEFNRAMTELETQKQVGSVEDLVEEVTIVPLKSDREQTVPSLGGSRGSTPEAEIADLREQLWTATMQLSALKAAQASQAADEQVAAVREECERQLNQLQSAHAEEVARLKQQYTQDVENSKQQLRKQHNEEINRLVSEHEREMQRWRNVMDVSTGGDEESLLELGHRLQTELEANEQLDSRLISLSTERLAYGQPQAESVDGVDGEISERLKAVLEKVHREGLRVLSLSELQLLQNHRAGLVAPASVDDVTLPVPASWQEERRSLLAALQSLKELLGRLQATKDLSRDGVPDADWRADLMQAVGAIFSREREELLSGLHGLRGEQRLPSVDHLEKRVHEQDARQTIAFKQILSADRRSLTGEVQALRQRLATLRDQRQDENSRLREDVNRMHDEYNKKERQLRRQMELLEYRIQQERAVSEDLRSSLEVEKSRTLELTSQLSREKSALTDLQNDLEDTQHQLTKLQQALEREQNRLLGASTALDEERNMASQLNNALSNEQANVKQALEELEDERRCNIRNQERSAQVIERLKQDLEHEKDRRLETEADLERERLTLSSVQREHTLGNDQYRNNESKLKAKIAEFRSALEMEKARTEELNNGLQRERQLNTQLREILEEERGSLKETSEREKLTITELQAVLDLERSKMLDIQTSLERERHKVHHLNDVLEVQKAQAADDLEQERSVCRNLKHTLDNYQIEKQDLARQLQFESEKSISLATDCTRLQASLLDVKERLREAQAQREADRVADKHRQRDLNRHSEEDRHKQGELETEMHKLRQKVTDLELQLAEVKRCEIQAREERDLERLRNTMSPSRTRASPAPRQSPERENGHVNAMGDVRWRELETLRQRMQLLVVRHQEELAKSIARLPESERRERGSGLELLRKSLKNLSAELEKIHSALVNGEPADSVMGLNEKILVQNSELTALMSQLSDEKHQALNRLAKAESELALLRERPGQTDREHELSGRLSSERATWARDQASLTMQLHESEMETARLKDDLRRVEILLEKEREKYFPASQVQSVPADKEKMQRLYGKYLRAESFRKALVYQKKYLLLLLGGFQDCEEQTLSMIAKMGGFPSENDMNHDAEQDPLSRFRSAARVIVAITRMKFLVRKWRRATRVGSTAVAGSSLQTHPGATSSYVPSTNGFSPARKTHSAQQHSHTALSDSRTSARSAMSLQTPPTRERTSALSHSSTASAAARREIFLIGAENGYGASHSHESMPSQEGEDSLSAYIERLEGVQIRLGNVTSQGSTDYSSQPRR